MNEIYSVLYILHFLESYSYNAQSAVSISVKMTEQTCRQPIYTNQNCCGESRLVSVYPKVQLGFPVKNGVLVHIKGSGTGALGACATTKSNVGGQLPPKPYLHARA